MRKEPYTWICVWKDGSTIESHPETGEDNTKEWPKIHEKQEDVKAFLWWNEGHKIGINFLDENGEADRYFFIGDNGIIPFHAEEELKLVQFMRRQVIQTAESLTEQPKIFVVGFENKDGKMFLCLQEQTGAWFFSNTTP